MLLWSFEKLAYVGTITLVDWDGAMCAMVDSEVFHVSGMELLLQNDLLALDQNYFV